MPKVPAAPVGQQVPPERAAASAIRARRGALGSSLLTTGTASRRTPNLWLLTQAEPHDPMMPSTGATVRDRRNAVRVQSETPSAIIGIRTAMVQARLAEQGFARRDWKPRTHVYWMAWNKRRPNAVSLKGV
jgi:hypothetical protein